VKLDAQGDLWGDWDPDRMAQVISNLVGNALQHSDGDVTVMLHGETDFVVLETNNGGPPIPRDVLAHIFEPGRRGDARAGGLGLGLFIVQQIVLGARGKHRGPLERARDDVHGGAPAQGSTEVLSRSIVPRMRIACLCLLAFGLRAPIGRCCAGRQIGRLLHLGVRRRGDGGRADDETSGCSTEADCSTTRVEVGGCCPMLCAPRVVTRERALALEANVGACSKGRQCAQPLCRPPLETVLPSCVQNRCVPRTGGPAY